MLHWSNRIFVDGGSWLSAPDKSCTFTITLCHQNTPLEQQPLVTSVAIQWDSTNKPLFVSVLGEQVGKRVLWRSTR